ncbi:MAG: glycosyltransferase [Myxococcota bacterium]
MPVETAWEINAAWLARHAPQLWQRLLDCGPSDRIKWSEGRLLWWRGLTPVEVVEPSPVDAPSDRDVVCLGFGRGDWVHELLQQSDRDVVVWDRHPGFLRPALQHRDWTTWLASGRLRLIAGGDLLKAQGPRVPHPVLGLRYADEARCKGGRRVLLVEGSLFVDDVAQALTAEGWSVFRWDVADLPTAELERTAAAVQPELVVGINHTHGLAEACERLGVPLIEWEIDPSTDALRQTQASGATVFTWRQRHVEPLRAAGFQAEYLPLATNLDRRAPAILTREQQQTYGVDVAYVGSSMVEQAKTLMGEFALWFERVHGDRAAGIHLGQSLLAVQAEQGDRYVLPTLLQQVAPDLAQRFADAGCAHEPAALLGEAAAATYRLRTLAPLGALGLHVWGDPGWAALASHGATYRGWAGHFDELTRIYSAARVHVDVGRLYQLDIVPMRIFDVIAAGGFVVAQHSEALAELLTPGVEVVTWKTPSELAEKVARYLADEGARKRVVQAGRARIVREHTIAHRVRHMLCAAAA